MHALAIGYGPAYLDENKDGIAQDWPRIPLPAARDALLASAALGWEVAALLDPETPVPGVTTGAIRPELRTIANLRKRDGSQINSAAGDLALTAGWGRGGHGRPVMPGRGQSVPRDFTPDETAALATWHNPLGLDTSAASPLGESTLDIFLNDNVSWSNIPINVWTYTIGGYQVIKKWLSYREIAVLDRPLTTDEAREVQHIARRIAALLLIQPRLDANYRAVTTDTYTWPEKAGSGQAAFNWEV